MILDDFRRVLFTRNCLRIRQKYFSVHGEYKRIWRIRLEHRMNTPIDIKLSLSRRILDKNQTKFEPSKSPQWTWSNWQKNISCYCLFKNITKWTTCDSGGLTLLLYLAIIEKGTTEREGWVSSSFRREGNWTSAGCRHQHYKWYVGYVSHLSATRRREHLFLSQSELWILPVAVLARRGGETAVWRISICACD